MQEGMWQELWVQEERYEATVDVYALGTVATKECEGDVGVALG
jgi:hypothetical protein